MSQDLTLAYAAGLLDGEGHFGIGRRQTGELYVFSARVVVGMNHKPTIDWLHSQFGGGVYKREATTAFDTSYSWALGSQPRIIEFLPGIIPFAKTKKVHATLLLDFLLGFPSITSTAANTKRHAEMSKYYEVMRGLNSEGPGAGELKESLAKVIKI